MIENRRNLRALAFLLPLHAASHLLSFHCDAVHSLPLGPNVQMAFLPQCSRSCGNTNVLLTYCCHSHRVHSKEKRNRVPQVGWLFSFERNEHSWHNRSDPIFSLCRCVTSLPRARSTRRGWA